MLRYNNVSHTCIICGYMWLFVNGIFYIWPKSMLKNIPKNCYWKSFVKEELIKLSFGI